MGRSEEGEPVSIVGREPQLSLINERLASLWDSASRTPGPLLLHFYGMRGIGKTRLLRAVEASVQAQPPGPGLITLFLAAPDPIRLSHQNEFAQYRSLEDIDDFFNEFYRQFQQATARQRGVHYTLVEYERLLANRSHLKDEDGLWLRAKTLASDLFRLHREDDLRVLVLQDGVPPKVFQWLSKFFYKDLMVERVMCVVATGYAPPVVSTLSLVQYFKSQLLQPLSPEEAGQALAPYNFPAGLANQLVEMAAGHPGSLMEGATSTKALLDEDKPEMFSETGALSRKGQAKVANAMAETLLQNIPANLARCCRLIAPLRTFRYDTLAALLPALLPVDPKYGRASVVDYMLLGKELNDQVDFIESDKTYVMHPIARAILSNALKYSDPTGSEAFRQVNEEAANYYAGLAERLERPEQRSDAVLEEIYHRLVLAHLEAETHQRPIQAELNQLVQVLKQRMPLLGGFEGSRRLASLLEADRDFQRLFPNEVDGLLQMLYESRLR